MVVVAIPRVLVVLAVPRHLSAKDAEGVGLIIGDLVVKSK